MDMDRKENQLDFLKGFLMLGVIYGHAVTALKGGYSVSTPIALLVRTYDMPFFMVISGYLLSKTIKRYSLFHHLANRIGNTVIPTFFIGGLLALVTYSVLGSLSLLNCVGYVLNIWFIWANFICAAIIIVVENLVPKDGIKRVVYVVIAASFHFLPTDPYNLSYMFPFYVLGFLYSACFAKAYQSKRRIWLPIAVFLYLVLFSFWKGAYTIWNAGGYVLENTRFVLGAVLFRLAIGVLGCLCVKSLSYTVFTLLGHDYPRARAFVCSVGRYSLVYYIVHAFLISQVLSTLAEIRYAALSRPPILIENSTLLQLVAAPVACCVTVLIIGAGIAVIKRFAPRFIQKMVFGIKFYNN